MESYAAGGTQGGQDGREDADEGLENELPVNQWKWIVEIYLFGVKTDYQLLWQRMM